MAESRKMNLLITKV